MERNYSRQQIKGRMDKKSRELTTPTKIFCPDNFFVWTIFLSKILFVRTIFLSGQFFFGQLFCPDIFFVRTTFLSGQFFFVRTKRHLPPNRILPNVYLQGTFYSSASQKFQNVQTQTENLLKS